VQRIAAYRLLHSLPARSISLLLTDPPYDSVERRGSGHLHDWFGGSMSWSQIGRLLRAARPKLRPDGLVFVLSNEAGLAGAQEALRVAGFARQRIVVWDKRGPGLGSGLRHHVEYAVIGLQPRSRGLSGRDLISVPAVAPNTSDRYPTQKPIGLGRELAAIAGVRRGDLVVDPFAGSGSLLVGARERGARVIAGDISARAVCLARQRLSPGSPASERTTVARTPRQRRRPTPRPPASLSARLAGLVFGRRQ
jgi:site-specific DNA-methyltransferase (adenine-specific)